MVIKRRGDKEEEGTGPTSESVSAKFLSDPKMQKGKQQALDNLKAMKGPSNKELKQEKKADALRRVAMEREKVNWKKKAGTMAALVLLCGAGLAQFIATVWGFIKGSGISTIDIKDTAAVKSLLFDGEPWLVYCVNNETVSQRLPQVLEESAHSLYSSLGVRSAVMSCWDPTESGRSVAQRFKMNLKPPLSFVVANGNKPRSINLLGISKTEDLEKRIKPALTLTTYKITTLKQWDSLCTSRRTCIVIGHKNAAQRDFALGLFKPQLEWNRAVRIVTLDTSFWQLKLDAGVLATRSTEKKGKAAEVLCLSRNEGAKGNATHQGTFLQDLDARGVTSFMKACGARSGLVELEKMPRIKARPTKPKKVSAPPPTPRPQAAPSPKPKDRGVRDHVGSRDSLESDDPLFEAVDDNEEEDTPQEGEDSEEEDGEEVEL